MTVNPEVTPCLSGGEWDNLRFEFTILVHRQQPHRNRQPKPPRAAGAGIEVEHALAAVEVGHVRVAEEHGGELSGGGVQVERVEVVEHVDVAAAEEENLRLRKLAARAVAVHIAADGGDRSDLAQILENGRLAHVAQVQNALDAGEGGGDFGAEEAVRIADDADLHGRLLKERFFAE